MAEVLIGFILFVAFSIIGFVRHNSAKSEENE
jgi:hypothetical protein